MLYEIGEEVERTLEERHYTGFLVSSTYHAMIHQAALQGVDFMTECAGRSVCVCSIIAENYMIFINLLTLTTRK